jgi:glycosyltransferase involved in cell wall biosynthesis
MPFSIITPSFRSAQWLPLCIASVADQSGVALEHIVQDSCSDDGTADWLPQDPRVKAYIEKDQGMYDAVNRGFRRATGDILAYLNCDEQYAPGALLAVESFFQAHPDVDAVFSDTVVTNRQGDYLCHRYALVPGKYQIWIRFPVLTCALFVRRRVVHELGIFFDPQWRDLGDLFWVMAMVNRGLRMAVLPGFSALFTDTGENMNLKPNALRERAVKQRMAPRWVNLLRYPFILQYRLQLAARGSLFQRPFHYSLYTQASPDRRVTRHVPHPTSFWRGR